MNGWNELRLVQAPFFRCPSFKYYPLDVRGSSPALVRGYVLTAQPIVYQGSADFVGAIRDFRLEGIDYGITNYAGCAGAAYGASNSIDPQLVAFRGMISTRERVTLDEIMKADGLAASIMYGENIGQHGRYLDTDVRFISAYQSWLNAGLSRGRGDVPWKADPPLADTPTRDYPAGGDPRSGILGRTGFSSVLGFGSSHPDGVGFVFGDGHLETLPRKTDWQVLYQKFGAFDADFPCF